LGGPIDRSPHWLPQSRRLHIAITARTRKGDFRGSTRQVCTLARVHMGDCLQACKCQRGRETHGTPVQTKDHCEMLRQQPAEDLYFPKHNPGRLLPPSCKKMGRAGDGEGRHRAIVPSSRYCQYSCAGSKRCTDHGAQSSGHRADLMISMDSSVRRVRATWTGRRVFRWDLPWRLRAG
jgi:hypothetical protein